MATSRTAKPKTLKPVRPNAGLAALYAKRLKALLAEMHASVTHFVGLAYRGNVPEIAQDASPAETIRAAIRRLTRRWTKRFDGAAQKLAAWFATSANARSDARLKGILKDAGISVEFQMTRAQNDVIRATIGQNVALIKSIPAEYLGKVEQATMRSIQVGRDIGGLTRELKQIYPQAEKRCAFIARTQNQLATSAMQRARQLEAGIKTAIWRHSSAGKKPRPTHVAMNGKEFDIVKGMWDSAEKAYVWPMQLINCRCSSLSVVPGFSL